MPSATYTEAQLAFVRAKYDDAVLAGERDKLSRNAVATDCNAHHPSEHDMGPEIVGRYFSYWDRDAQGLPRVFRPDQLENEVVDFFMNNARYPSIGARIIIAHTNVWTEKKLKDHIEHKNKVAKTHGMHMGPRPYRQNKYNRLAMWGAYRQSSQGYVDDLMNGRIHWETGKRAIPDDFAPGIGQVQVNQLHRNQRPVAPAFLPELIKTKLRFAVQPGSILDQLQTYIPFMQANFMQAQAVQGAHAAQNMGVAPNMVNHVGQNPGFQAPQFAAMNAPFGWLPGPAPAPAPQNFGFPVAQYQFGQLTQGPMANQHHRNPGLQAPQPMAYQYPQNSRFPAPRPQNRPQTLRLGGQQTHIQHQNPQPTQMPAPSNHHNYAVQQQQALPVQNFGRQNSRQQSFRQQNLAVSAPLQPYVPQQLHQPIQLGQVSRISFDADHDEQSPPNVGTYQHDNDENLPSPDDFADAIDSNLAVSALSGYQNEATNQIGNLPPPDYFTHRVDLQPQLSTHSVPAPEAGNQVSKQKRCRDEDEHEIHQPASKRVHRDEAALHFMQGEFHPDHNLDEFDPENFDPFAPVDTSNFPQEEVERVRATIDQVAAENGKEVQDQRSDSPTFQPLNDASAQKLLIETITDMEKEPFTDSDWGISAEAPADVDGISAPLQDDNVSLPQIPGEYMMTGFVTADFGVSADGPAAHATESLAAVSESSTNLAFGSMSDEDQIEFFKYGIENSFE